MKDIVYSICTTKRISRRSVTRKPNIQPRRIPVGDTRFKINRRHKNPRNHAAGKTYVRYLAMMVELFIWMLVSLLLSDKI